MTKNNKDMVSVPVDEYIALLNVYTKAYRYVAAYDPDVDMFMDLDNAVDAVCEITKKVP